MKRETTYVVATPDFIGLTEISNIGKTGTHVPSSLCVLSEHGPSYIVSYIHFIPFINIQMLPSQTSYVKVLGFPSSFERKLELKLGNTYLYLNTTAVTKYDC